MHKLSIMENRVIMTFLFSKMVAGLAQITHGSVGNISWY